MALTTATTTTTRLDPIQQVEEEKENNLLICCCVNSNNSARLRPASGERRERKKEKKKKKRKKWRANLFRVAELFENGVVVARRDALGEADDRLDVGLERPFQQLVDLAVVVVVVPDAEHAGEKRRKRIDQDQTISIQ